MPKGFLNIRYHAAEKQDEELESVGTRGLAYRGLEEPPPRDTTSVSFNNDESAARFYLSRVFEQDDRPRVRGMAAPERAESTPDLKMVSSQNIPLTKTRLVQFAQTQSSVPVFGSRINVELDENRELVHIAGDIASEIKELSAIPTLGAKQALNSIVELAGVHEDQLASLKPPELTFFMRKIRKVGTWPIFSGMSRPLRRTF